MPSFCKWYMVFYSYRIIPYIFIKKLFLSILNNSFFVQIYPHGRIQANIHTHRHTRARAPNTFSSLTLALLCLNINTEIHSLISFLSLRSFVRSFYLYNFICGHALLRSLFLSRSLLFSAMLAVVVAAAPASTVVLFPLLCAHWL